MKKLFFNKSGILSICCLAVLSTFFSCKKMIELPGNPPTQITRGQQFADSSSTLSAVAGIYTYNYSPGFAYSDALLTVTTALSAREVSIASVRSTLPQFYSYTITPLTNEIPSLWSTAYKSIYQVNDVLEGITNNPNLSASFVSQISGELAVVRALYYFNLVNLFGGVPLVTSTDYDSNAKLPRASVNEVYTQIFSDLSSAIKKLGANYPSGGRARPNLYTALALLAKANLYQKQWQAAYDQSDLIIKSGKYTLTSSLNDVFLNASNEAIWQLPVTSDYAGTTEASYFVPYSSTRVPSFIVTQSLLSQFETGDLRMAKWLGVNVVNGQTLYYPYKYQDLEPTSPATDYMVFRLAEIYLIHAEAAAQLNNLSGALADINLIRSRAGLGASTANTTSQGAVLEAVAKERQTELCFEWGNRWFDLKRTDKAAGVLPGYQNDNALYPLPQAQLQLNSQLVQNPGYN